MSSLPLSPRDVGVILVAAGQGARVGGEPKQFRTVAGVPMLLRAVRPFLAHPDVGTVVVVLPAATAARPPGWLDGLAGDRLLLVAGGATRSDSVRSGLEVLPASCVTVLVHDGARPFVSTVTIDVVIAEARAGHAAVAAIPIQDSVKRVEVCGDGQMRVVETVPRKDLWRAQTPQGFPRALLVQAHAGQADAPDDAALVELLGAMLVIVPDSAHNLKVTTADDLLLAEAIAGLQSA